jgi:hypothetical protein
VEERPVSSGKSWRRRQAQKTRGGRGSQCEAWRAPRIIGGSPGSGFGSSSSPSWMTRGGGKKTVPRVLARPFPLSFFASGLQHAEQISYSLPSISFCRQCLASPQRSQVIMGSPRSSSRWFVALHFVSAGERLLPHCTPQGCARREDGGLKPAATRQSEEHSQEWLCYKCEEGFLDCAGRRVRRCERGRKSRPASLGMTGRGWAHGYGTTEVVPS